MSIPCSALAHFNCGTTAVLQRYHCVVLPQWYRSGNALVLEKRRMKTGFGIAKGCGIACWVYRAVPLAGKISNLNAGFPALKTMLWKRYIRKIRTFWKG